MNKTRTANSAIEIEKIMDSKIQRKYKKLKMQFVSCKKNQIAASASASQFYKENNELRAMVKIQEEKIKRLSQQLSVKE